MLKLLKEDLSAGGASSFLGVYSVFLRCFVPQTFLAIMYAGMRTIRF
ncbi:hypothetical protein [Selenomonas sp. oral taxon 136]|nr:hypothetical protein [Selenomonas sp. oral taxon 136]